MGQYTGEPLLWQLEEFFNNRDVDTTAKSKLLMLVRALHDLRMGPEENAYKLIARVKELQHMLSDVDHTVAGEIVVTAVLAGLPQRLSGFVQSVMLMQDTPSLDELLGKFVAIEGIHKQQRENDERSEAALSLFTRGGVNGKRPECAHCGKSSHNINNCWRKNPCSHCGRPGHPEEKMD